MNQLSVEGNNDPEKDLMLSWTPITKLTAFWTLPSWGIEDYYVVAAVTSAQGTAGEITVAQLL
jgi:hypothetical protein